MNNKPCTHEIVQEAMRIVSKDVIPPKYVRSMNKIPTARKFYDSHESDDTVVMMIDFAKLHVEAALKEAAEKACIKTSKDGFIEIDKQSIINAYDLNTIK